MTLTAMNMQNLEAQNNNISKLHSLAFFRLWVENTELIRMYIFKNKDDFFFSYYFLLGDIKHMPRVKIKMVHFQHVKKF